MRKNNKLVAIVISLLLFAGLVYSIFTITQTKNNYQEPVIFVFPDKQKLTPANAFDSLLAQKDSIVNGFFNPGYSQYKWWVYVKISNQLASYLQVGNPHINKI
ncbi:MAG: hypothetical protein B7Z27_08645, partial [Sphingobacteriia bacterium 32-37-4]